MSWFLVSTHTPSHPDNLFHLLDDKNRSGRAYPTVCGIKMKSADMAMVIHWGDRKGRFGKIHVCLTCAEKIPELPA